jgi:hypothetical protein
MKKRIKIPYWVNWVTSAILFLVIFVINWGLIVFVLFSKAEPNNYNQLEHVPIAVRYFDRDAMIWLMFLFSGIPFVAGYVIHGWVLIEEVDY